MTTRRRWPAAVVVGLIACAGTVPALAAPRPALIDTRLGLRSQQFEVTASGLFVAVVDVPDTIDADQLAASTLTVTAHGRLDGRADVTAAIQGDLPRFLDAVDLPTALLPTTGEGGLQVVVPLESTTRTRDLLQLPRAGLYPVTIEMIVDGEVLADVVTFVHRLPDEGIDSSTALPVALVARTVEPLRLDDDGNVVITDEAVDELDRLASSLEGSPAPITFALQPALIDALDDSGADAGDGAIVDRLADALDDDALLAAPALPLDPSAAVETGQGSRYTQWLRQGDDMLGALTSEPPDRSVVILDAPPSAAGAALERDLGGRVAVLTRAAFDSLPAAPAELGDTSLLIGLGVGGGVSLPASVVDREVAEILVSGAEPSLTAVYVLTHLLAAREDLLLAEIDPSRRAVTVGTVDLSLPDPAVLEAVGTLLASVDGIEATTVDELSSADVLTGDTGPLTIELPTTIDHDLDARVVSLDGLGFELRTTGTMLPAGSARLVEWERLLGTLLTSALTDDQVAAIAAELSGELADLRAGVILPEGFAFTLTGRGSEVPVKLGNDSTVPLTVLVRLSSTKLRFPAGGQTVTLEPGQLTEVRVPIEARANGTFPVTLEVLTPDGAARLGTPVTLTATVNALAGLGNLITGALALVVLAWWMRSARRSRRSRATAEAARRHPVTNTAAGATSDDDGRDGDAGRDDDPTAPTTVQGTTTLPDS